MIKLDVLKSSSLVEKSVIWENNGLKEMNSELRKDNTILKNVLENLELENNRLKPEIKLCHCKHQEILCQTRF